MYVKSHFFFRSHANAKFYICGPMQQTHYNRIKGALADLGVTNKELAEHLEVNPNTVSRWCTNDQQPSLEMLFRVAEYLNIDVRELIVPNKVSSGAARKK